MLKSFIDLKFFLYSLELEEGCTKPHNFKCRLLGHESTKAVKDNMESSEWKSLLDGFKFKEVEGVCKRCGSVISLYQYPQWPQHVFAVKRCKEKI
jgi:hypothetical protein